MGTSLPKRKSEIRILEEGLAPERRQVVSDWRAILIFRRYDKKDPYSGVHRFTKLPVIRSLLSRLVETGELAELEPKARLYQINSPYAHQLPLLEWEVLMEASPLCVVSHYSAMVFHQLTEDFPTEMHAILPARAPDWYPIGTAEDDWDEEAPPKGKRIERIFNLEMHWHLLGQLQGIREYKPGGYPIRVTTPERTLLEGLMEPDWCGGIEKVFRAWVNAREALNAQSLVDLIEVFNIAILRQRAGFVMESIGIQHPALATWPSKAQRGGTSKLLAKAPYQPAFNEKWHLSINTPIGTLIEAKN